MKRKNKEVKIMSLLDGPATNAPMKNLSSSPFAPVEIELPEQDNAELGASWQVVNLQALQLKVAEANYRALVFQKVAEKGIDLTRYNIVDLPAGRCKFVLKTPAAGDADGQSGDK